MDPTGTVQLKFTRPQLSKSTGTIPTRRDFERELAPVLKDLDSSSRRLFVADARKLAKRKLEFERLREHYRQKVPDVRASIRTHGKLITLVHRAIQTLLNAHEVAVVEDNQLLKNFEVTEAMRMLMAAENDLVWVKDHMLPAMIYPKLRKPNEKPSQFKIPEHAQPTIPGFGLVKIDNWLISELDQLLDRCQSLRGNGRVINRDKIIQAVFRSAFPNAGRQLEQIKTARRRAKRQR